MPTDDKAVTAPDITVLHLPGTVRARKLRMLNSFVNGTQHDHHGHSFAGSPREPGVGYLWERMKPHGFIPANAASTAANDRKPDCSYPLARQVTMRFTELLLGEGRTPQAESRDSDTSEYLAAIYDSSDIWDTLIEARDYSGATGSAAICIGVVNGEPVSEMLETEHLHVFEWQSGSRWEPVSVAEQVLTETEALDPKTGKLETSRVWQTRIWDEEYIYSYEDVPEDYGEKEEKENKPPPKIPPLKDSDGNQVIHEHNAGRCPVFWLQNTRNQKRPEGRPDNDGVHELGDSIDKLQSFVIRASKANVDPTLVYLDDRNMHRKNPVLKKGWGSLIKGSEKAKVQLLEINGASLEMGWRSVHSLKDEYLQTVSCVIVDPQNSGMVQSGEALALLWRAMEAKANRLRVPVRDVIQQMSKCWISIGRNMDIISAEDDDGDDNEDASDKAVMILDPKQGTKGEAVGPQRVGKGSRIKVSWPPYHVPTPPQIEQMSNALKWATGEKPFTSQESAVAEWASFVGRDDAAAEYERILAEKNGEEDKLTKAMFPPELPDAEDIEDEDDDDEDDD